MPEVLLEAIMVVEPMPDPDDIPVVPIPEDMPVVAGAAVVPAAADRFMVGLFMPGFSELGAADPPVVRGATLDPLPPLAEEFGFGGLLPEVCASGAALQMPASRALSAISL